MVLTTVLPKGSTTECPKHRKKTVFPLMEPGCKHNVAYSEGNRCIDVYYFSTCFSLVFVGSSELLIGLMILITM